MHFHQTVKFAVDNLRNERIFATQLLTMEPEEFTALRRSVLQYASETPPTARMTCGICGSAVHLARHGSGNRYFRHHTDISNCPWFTGGTATRELRDAEEFLWEKESAEHFRLKWAVCDALNRDPEVNNTAKVQETLWSGLMHDRWRRPDIRCTWRGREIAFELQLGTTHLREVVARENFYREEKIFVIWVFHPAALATATRTDEHYFNRRNIFVVHEPEESSEPHQGLRLLCRYDEPNVNTRGDTWISAQDAIIGLADLTFPEDHYRPFYFDFIARRAAVVAESARIVAELRAVAEREAAERREIAEREAAERRRRNPPGLPAKLAPTPPAPVTRLPVQADPELGVKALGRYRDMLDRYREQTDWAQSRIAAFAPILMSFPSLELRAAGSNALHAPWFQLLLFIRGLEIATPFPASNTNLADWCNARLQELDGADIDPLFALIGYAAWSAYPPSQPKDIHARHSARFAQFIQQVESTSRQSGPDKSFVPFVCTLFPRVGQILGSKLRIE